jgi:hypothetical protein
MPKERNQQRGGFNNGPPHHGSRGGPKNRGRGRGRDGPPAHSPTPFVNASQQLFESSASATGTAPFVRSQLTRKTDELKFTVEVFDFNNMPSLDALNSQKPIFRGRGRGRGGLSRGIPRGGPGLPVNAQTHPVYIPQATKRNHNGQRGGVRGALPAYDADYLDPYTHFNYIPLPALSKGGGLGFDKGPGPNTKPVGNGGGRWDPATRPLLKPVKFVRAKERLFEADPDELLQAHELKPHPSQCFEVSSSLYLCQTDDLDPQVEIMEDIILHHEQPPNEVPSSSGDGATVNTKMAAHVEMAVKKKSGCSSKSEDSMEEVVKGLHAVAVNQDVVVPILRPEADLHVEESEQYYFHPTPQELPTTTSSGILFDRVTELAIGQSHAEDDEDDEIILYPSKTRRGTVPSPPSVVPSVVTHEEAISALKAPTPSNDIPINIPTSFSIGNPSTRSTFVPMRMRKEAKRTRQIERNKQKAKESVFFGEETRITGYADAKEFIDGSPRVGDSDIEWGSDGPPQTLKDGVFVERAETSESDDGGMAVDVELDEAALARFAMSMENPQHSVYNDLEGAEESDGEDEDVVGSDISADLLGSESSEDSDEWTDEENQTPDAQWQSRLMKMRKNVKSKRRETAADRDEDCLAYLEVSAAYNTGGVTIFTLHFRSY